jgi:hypothetical protein
MGKKGVTDWTWVKMLLLACSAFFALVGGFYLLMCVAMLLGEEFDHGGFYSLMMGTACVSIGGLFAYTILRAREDR